MTYIEAKMSLLRRFKDMGLETNPFLKTPWVKLPGRRNKLYFKPQAIWVGESRPEYSTWKTHKEAIALTPDDLFNTFREYLERG